MEPDRRVALVVEPLEHGGGKRLVDRGVALPGLFQPPVEVRRLDEIPEVVLEEPERGVRELVVEPVERLLLVGHEPKPVQLARPPRPLDRPAGRLRGDGAILVGQRAGDPGHVMVCDQGAERR